MKLQKNKLTAVAALGALALGGALTTQAQAQQRDDRRDHGQTTDRDHGRDGDRNRNPTPIPPLQTPQPFPGNHTPRPFRGNQNSHPFPGNHYPGPFPGNHNPRPLPRPLPPVNNGFRTFSGTVTSEFRGGFDLRTGFTTLRVYADYNRIPRQLSRGDEVRVSGFLNGNNFRANGVSVLRNR